MQTGEGQVQHEVAASLSGALVSPVLSGAQCPVYQAGLLFVARADLQVLSPIEA